MDEQLTEQSIKELEKENLSLKFAAVHKDLQTFRDEISKHLHLILEQTSKTNGSVAKAALQIHDATTKIHEVEHLYNEMETELVSLRKELVEYKKDTQFWYTLQTNKWLVIPIVLAFYALTLKEVRDLIISILK